MGRREHRKHWDFGLASGVGNDKKGGLFYPMFDLHENIICTLFEMLYDICTRKTVNAYKLSETKYFN